MAIINEGKLIAENTPQELSEAFMGYQEIVLQVKGPNDKIMNTKTFLKFRVLRPRKLFKDKICEYVVKSEKEKDIREILFYSMAEQGFPILEMKSSFMTLEDIFLELVTEEPKLASPKGDEQ